MCIPFNQVIEETKVPVSVVIPTCNRSELLERTLRSLAECELPKNYRQLIVVENGKQLGAESIVASCPAHLAAAYRYHAVGNKSAALNSMLAEFDDELLVFFDDDVRIEPGTIAAYATSASNHTNTFFGGPTGVDYEVQPADWIQRFLPPSAKGLSFPDDTIYVDEPKFMGFNWAANVRDLRSVGGFDETVGPGTKYTSTGDESGLQRKLLAAGLRGRYVADALVWHYVPKARCTPEWVIQRNLQGGIAQGLRSNDGGFAFRGWSPTALKQAARLRLQLIKESIQGNESDAFYAKWRLARLQGVARGNRLRVQG